MIELVAYENSSLKIPPTQINAHAKNETIRKTDFYTFLKTHFSIKMFRTKNYETLRPKIFWLWVIHLRKIEKNFETS